MDKTDASRAAQAALHTILSNPSFFHNGTENRSFFIGQEGVLGKAVADNVAALHKGLYEYFLTADGHFDTSLK